MGVSTLSREASSQARVPSWARGEASERVPFVQPRGMELHLRAAFPRNSFPAIPTLARLSRPVNPVSRPMISQIR
jgi:hypothetical protein